MNDHIRPALAALGMMVALTGIAYPLAMTGLGQALMPVRANASVIERDGQIVGSSLVGQGFTAPGYLHPRPSAVDYNAASAAASNLGPTSATLLATQAERATAFRAENGTDAVPVDAVTGSGSGLDPHVSPDNAAAQVARIAQARGLSASDVQAMVNAATTGRWLGIFGDPHVNVLAVNLALDAATSVAPTETAPEG